MMTEWEQLTSLLDMYNESFNYAFELTYKSRDTSGPVYTVAGRSFRETRPTLAPIIKSFREHLIALSKREKSAGIANIEEGSKNIERIGVFKDKLNKWDKENKE